MTPVNPSNTGEGGHKILVIDDDKKLCRLIGDYLEPMCYDVTAVHEGLLGVDRAIEGEWHAIILDVMLPGLDGFEVLRRIRQKKETPILMLTARGDEADRIVGLEMGADDYLPKTFSTRELLARLRAVTRRTGREASEVEEGSEIVIRDLRIFPESRAVVLSEKRLELTPVEYDILFCLAQAKGRVKSREQLLDEVAGRDYDVFDRSIDVHVSGLRKKLADDPKEPRFIKTVRSVGYMMINPDESRY